MLLHHFLFCIYLGYKISDLMGIVDKNFNFYGCFSKKKSKKRKKYGNLLTFFTVSSRYFLTCFVFFLRTLSISLHGKNMIFTNRLNGESGKM